MATQTRRRNGKVPPTPAAKPAAPAGEVQLTPDQAVAHMAHQELLSQIGRDAAEIARLRATVRILQAQLAAATPEPAADVPA